MNMSRARGPRYSLEYLTFMATKKRKEREASTDMDGREELGDEGSSSAKRPRLGFPPTVTETMRELWNDMRADGFTI
jgi:chromatin structure-remodeling complex subunit RSC1/2